MDTGAKVSIIIPVYNTKKLIRNSINSVLNQSYKNWELILVDDGSTDNSGNICEEYTNDKRIKVIHQDNRGALFARLTGVEVSSGQFILFLDADDLLSERMLYQLICIERRYNADIVCCKSKTMSKHGMIKWSASKGKPTVRSSTGEEEALRMAAAASSMELWGKLYKSTLLHEAARMLRTIPNVFWGEDSMMNAAIFSKADKVVFTEEALYLYRIGGLSRTFYDRRIEELVALYEWRKTFLMAHEADVIYHRSNLAQVLNSMIYFAHYSKEKVRRDVICKKMKPVIDDIDVFYPDYKHKNEFNPKNSMSDGEFRKLYKEKIVVKLKRFLLSIL